MTLIDTHAHLDERYSTRTAGDLITEAKAAGVDRIITIATDAENSSNVQQLSEKFENLFNAVGIHPHEASKVKPNDLDEIRKRLAHEKCLALGEIGLDYHYDFSSPTEQRSVFEEQLAIAAETSMPVIVHSREAEEDLLESLSKFAKRSSCANPGVIHCFTGSMTFGLKCLDLGFFISFSGILTFNNATEIQEAARLFPLDRILVETDSPFLAPIPFRGKKCEPKMVVETAKKLALLRKLSFDEIAEATTSNAINLFKF